MKHQYYLLYPTEKQKQIIEDTFKSSMIIYNKLIEYSRCMGKEEALKYNTKPKLYKKLNEIKNEENSLTPMDTSTIECLVNTYNSDLEKAIVKNRRYPLKKVDVRSYSLKNNVLNKNGIEFYNVNYIKLPGLGYVKLDKKDVLPVTAEIDKVEVERDRSSNYRITVEYEDYDNINIGLQREEIKDKFWEAYEQGYFPNGEKIPYIDTKIKRKFRLLDLKTDTELRCNIDDDTEDPKIKKEIVKINYVNRDYVKKVDEYNHAMKLYKKYPEKFSRGVIFGHTIILVDDDGVNFKVIYDKNPMSSYRKWNVKILPKEEELIRRNCQPGMMRNFPEMFEEENIVDLQQSEDPVVYNEIIDDNIIIEEKDEDNIIVMDEEDYIAEYKQQQYLPETEEDELAKLLIDSNIYNMQQQQRLVYNPQQYNVPASQQYSGNSNWNFTNSYYNSQY